MFTGIVVAFAGEGNDIPQGWELCDGRLLDKNEPKYKPLFAVIGTIHGGAATPHFQLPDYRGRFLRGVDSGVGRDPDAPRRGAPGQANSGNPGDRIGSVQDDGMRSHGHGIPGLHLEASGGGGFDGAGLETNSNRSHPWTRDYETRHAGGAETRPKNAFVHWIIKL
jgi:hypothetical protein